MQNENCQHPVFSAKTKTLFLKLHLQVTQSTGLVINRWIEIEQSRTQHFTVVLSPVSTSLETI